MEASTLPSSPSSPISVTATVSAASTRRRYPVLARLLRHLMPQTPSHHQPGADLARPVPLGRRLVNHLRRQSGGRTSSRRGLDLGGDLISSPLASMATGSAPRREESCVICCAESTELGQPLIRTCTSCMERLCGPCLQQQFCLSVRDFDPISFPPECTCGGIIPLHVAKPFLDESTLAQYRARFDQWSTAFPLYCPVPTCSIFVHDRHIPPAAIAAGGSGLVERYMLECPEGHCFCSTCRLAHDSAAQCIVPDNQPDTTAAVEASIRQWGYKRCPKCRTGVKRMFGCAHILCRCGAHWCWVCERGITQCHQIGLCDDPDDESDCDFEDETEPEAQAVAHADTEATSTAPQSDQPLHPDLPARNLDAATLPANRNLDLNGEPNEPRSGVYGRCAHRFLVYREPKPPSDDDADAAPESPAERLIPSNYMECHRCWAPIRDLDQIIRTLGGQPLPEPEQQALYKRTQSKMDKLFRNGYFQLLDLPKLRDKVCAQLDHSPLDPPAQNPSRPDIDVSRVAFTCVEHDCRLLVCNGCAAVLAQRVKDEQQAAEDLNKRDVAEVARHRADGHGPHGRGCECAWEDEDSEDEGEDEDAEEDQMDVDSDEDIVVPVAGTGAAMVNLSPAEKVQAEAAATAANRSLPVVA